MVDSLFAIATVEVPEEFGYQTSTALARKHLSKTVHIISGTDTAAIGTIKMSLSRALRV